jgi:hypothetical protein
MSRAIVLALFVTSLAACGSSSPTTPSSADSPRVLQGQTVSAVNGSPTASLAVAVGSRHPVTTDAEGRFSVDVGASGTYTVTVHGSSIVDRETSVSGSSENMRLSVIPTNFDMSAFDEMFRSGGSRLQRWTTKPALVVLATTMNFRSTSDDEFPASGEQMSDEDVSQLVAQLSEGLALMTGNAFTSFASIEVERPQAGERVAAVRTGKIVVGRYTGIASLANTIGYGRWLETAGGTIIGGSMFLDRDFDQGDARRRLLRVHELGHALGYQHVRSRTSIMNPAIGPEPTDFDRIGALIAFQRPPGNRTPDIDPSGVTASISGEGAARWSPPVLCQ